jgi:hypothetical protein
MISNVELARKMGHAGRAYVEKRYGWRVIAELMERLYSTAVHDQILSCLGRSHRPIEPFKEGSSSGFLS